MEKKIKAYEKFIEKAAWLLGLNGFSLMTLPIILVALIITILTCFYVKHYYFLENHIQKLYEYTKKLHNL